MCSTHRAKGLELDRIVVPGVTAAAYCTPMDRNLLYVACTRAMHQRFLTHTAKHSELILA